MSQIRVYANEPVVKSVCKFKLAITSFRSKKPDGQVTDRANFSLFRL